MCSLSIMDASAATSAYVAAKPVKLKVKANMASLFTVNASQSY